MVRALHAAILVALSLLAAAGCGDGYSHLPPPRVPDGDEEEVATSPPPSSAPESAGPSQSPPPTAPAASSPAVKASAATGAAKPGPAAGGVVPAAKEVAAAPTVGVLDTRKRTLDQLQQIGRLFDGFRGQGSNYHTYPGPYTLPNLSWRVALLSSLEQYEALAGSFRKEEPWDGPQNRRSLRKIPDLFQPPQRQDEKTHLVLVTGPGTIYEDGRQARESSCPDGLEETILVVAVDDAFAVPWTSPQEYAFRPETVHQAFFGLYKDCCYALFGGATGVRRIPATISDEHLLALITPDGGEAVTALEVTRQPTPEPDEELLQYLKERPIVRFAKKELPSVAVEDASAKGGQKPPEVVAAAVSSSTSSMAGPSKEAASGPVTAATTDGGRRPVPDEVSQQLARRTLREAHHEQYAAAKTDEKKKELADKLLARARSADLDPAGRYVALELSRKIAIEIGDIPKALESLELTTQGFQTEGHAEKAEILVSSIGLPLSENDNDLVLSEARKWMETALQKNEFDLAERFLNAALSAARRTRDVQLIGALTARKKEIADARTAWLEVADYIDLLLQHPTHPEANELVGTYYCLVKQRWEDGLPLLARAADPRLAELADLELKRPATPSEQLALADRWWMYAEGEAKHKLALRARAAYWYRQALSGLPPGLERIKAETRLAKGELKGRGEQATETP